MRLRGNSRYGETGLPRRSAPSGDGGNSLFGCLPVAVLRTEPRNFLARASTIGRHRSCKTRRYQRFEGPHDRRRQREWRPGILAEPEYASSSSLRSPSAQRARQRCASETADSLVRLTQSMRPLCSARNAVRSMRRFRCACRLRARHPLVLPKECARLQQAAQTVRLLVKPRVLKASPAHRVQRRCRSRHQATPAPRAHAEIHPGTALPAERVQRSWFRIPGSWFRVPGFGRRIETFGPILRSRFRVSQSQFYLPERGLAPELPLERESAPEPESGLQALPASSWNLVRAQMSQVDPAQQPKSQQRWQRPRAVRASGTGVPGSMRAAGVQLERSAPSPPGRRCIADNLIRAAQRWPRRWHPDRRQPTQPAFRRRRSRRPQPLATAAACCRASDVARVRRSQMPLHI
jgi:hypothetical protein